MTSVVVQHSAEVVDTAVVHTAGLDYVVWEAVNAEILWSELVADCVVCGHVDVGAGVVHGCIVVAPIVLDCIVDIVLGVAACCTLGGTAFVFGCTVDDCQCGVETAFDVACQFGKSAL